MTADPAPPILAPIRSPASVQHAIAEIREAIVSGRLPSGRRLIETDLARQLALSRGPVRDALQQLSREGLVTIRPRRGAIVNAVTAADVLEVYALRASLGMLALQNLLGANRVTPAFLDHLEKLALRARAGRRHQRLIVAADLAFQSAIVDASDLPRVAARFRELTVEVRLFIRTLRIQYDDVDEILADHGQLINAFRAGDLRRAERVWRGRFNRAVHEFAHLVPGGDDLLRERHWLVKTIDE
jgi:DNA-binding GntR family transcriptional regulator